MHACRGRAPARRTPASSLYPYCHRTTSPGMFFKSSFELLFVVLLLTFFSPSLFLFSSLFFSVLRSRKRSLVDLVLARLELQIHPFP